MYLDFLDLYFSARMVISIASGSVCCDDGNSIAAVANFRQVSGFCEALNFSNA